MNRELALANAIAHGEFMGHTVMFGCENCHYHYFELVDFKQKISNRHEDVIIERQFYLRCARCGSEEGTKVLTIVPSWSAPNIDRDKLPEWRGEE